MNQAQAQKDIALIRDMISKSRRDTADSGPLFIGTGLFTLAVIMAMHMFQKFGLYYLEIPSVIFMFIGNGIIGYLTVGRRNKMDKVTSYIQSVFLSLWGAIGIVALMIVFLFPMTGVYNYNLVPVISFIIMGIGFFATGAMYELRFVQLISIVWWGGACLMAYVDGPLRLLVGISVIVFGFILPGYILNMNFRTRSEVNEAR